ncbi:MAG: hypothetical protein B7733_23805 [Myxococcales bacterium FL481]|nr:MAG: hypothetical protein B7733_23805 [Myxococcales bacterium FL481]
MLAQGRRTINCNRICIGVCAFGALYLHAAKAHARFELNRGTLCSAASTILEGQLGSNGWASLSEANTALALLSGTDRNANNAMAAQTRVEFRVTDADSHWDTEAYGERRQVCAVVTAIDACNYESVCWLGNGEWRLERRSDPAHEKFDECEGAPETIASGDGLPALAPGSEYAIAVGAGNGSSPVAELQFAHDGLLVESKAIEHTLDRSYGLAGFRSDRLVVDIRVMGQASAPDCDCDCELGDGLIAADQVEESDSCVVRKSWESIEVDPARELMIVHPAVVDPYLNGGLSHNGPSDTSGGVLSLANVLQQLALQLDAEEKRVFYHSLFASWLSDQTLDDANCGSFCTVEARDLQFVRDRMLKLFSYEEVGGDDDSRVYQLSKLPFELIAVVPRFDLAPPDGSDLGELRLVYRLATPFEGHKMTLIAEFRVPPAWFTLEQWAHQWHRLGEMMLGSQEYLDALRSNVLYVTRHHTAWPTLRDIRTNEIAFDSDAGDVARWELREFRLSDPSHAFWLPWGEKRFVASPLENTPHESLNGSAALSAVLADSPLLNTPGLGYLGFRLSDAFSRVFGGEVPAFETPRIFAGQAWAVDSTVAPRAVENFGLLTCNGCHQDHKVHDSAAGEVDFYHVDPLSQPGPDGQSRLSKFLTEPAPLACERDSRPGELNRRIEIYRKILDRPWEETWLDL